MDLNYPKECNLTVKAYFSDANQKTKEHMRVYENPTVIRLESEILKDPKKRFLVASKTTKRQKEKFIEHSMVFTFVASMPTDLTITLR